MMTGDNYQHATSAICEHLQSSKKRPSRRHRNYSHDDLKTQWRELCKLSLYRQRPSSLKESHRKYGDPQGEERSRCVKSALNPAGNKHQETLPEFGTSKDVSYVHIRDKSDFVLGGRDRQFFKGLIERSSNRSKSEDSKSSSSENLSVSHLVNQSQSSFDQKSSMSIPSNKSVSLDSDSDKDLNTVKVNKIISTAEVTPELPIKLDVPQTFQPPSPEIPPRTLWKGQPLSVPETQLTPKSLIGNRVARSLSRSPSFTLSHEGSRAVFRDPRFPHYWSSLDDSCPCERHHKKMQTFYNWFLDREDLRENRRQTRKSTHRPIPDFREAFPLKSTDWNSVDAKRGKKIRHVYNECMSNWIGYTKRHPLMPSLRSTISGFMRNRRMETINTETIGSGTIGERSIAESGASTPFSMTSSVLESEMPQTLGSQVMAASIAPEVLIHQNSMENTIKTDKCPAIQGNGLNSNVPFVHVSPLIENGSRPNGSGHNTQPQQVPFWSSPSPGIQQPVASGTNGGEWRMEVDLSTQPGMTPRLRESGPEPSGIYKVGGWGYPQFTKDQLQGTGQYMQMYQPSYQPRPWPLPSTIQPLHQTILQQSQSSGNPFMDIHLFTQPLSYPYTRPYYSYPPSVYSYLPPVSFHVPYPNQPQYRPSQYRAPSEYLASGKKKVEFDEKKKAKGKEKIISTDESEEEENKKRAGKIKVKKRITAKSEEEENKKRAGKIKEKKKITSLAESKGSDVMTLKVPPKVQKWKPSVKGSDIERELANIKEKQAAERRAAERRAAERRAAEEKKETTETERKEKETLERDERKKVSEKFETENVSRKGIPSTEKILKTSGISFLSPEDKSRIISPELSVIQGCSKLKDTLDETSEVSPFDTLSPKANIRAVTNDLPSAQPSSFLSRRMDTVSTTPPVSARTFVTVTPETPPMFMPLTCGRDVFVRTRSKQTRFRNGSLSWLMMNARCHSLFSYIRDSFYTSTVFVVNGVPKRSAYWPPYRDKRSRFIELPSGKKAFVFNIKRDEDGELEPALVFIDAAFNRKCYFVEEEFDQFIKLVPRLRSYFELWEIKAKQVRDNVEKRRRIQLVADKQQPSEENPEHGISPLDD